MNLGNGPQPLYLKSSKRFGVFKDGFKNVEKTFGF